MHHQNVPLKNAPPKRTLLTSFQRSLAELGLWGQQLLAGVVLQGTSEKRSKEYVLVVHFLAVRFDGASGACQHLLGAPHERRQLNPKLYTPSHLRPVILKPVGRIFEISDSNPIREKCGKCGRPSHPRKTRV